MLVRPEQPSACYCLAGIAPSSVPLFIGAQIIGAALGSVAVLLLFPDAPATADRVVVPHTVSTSKKG